MTEELKPHQIAQLVNKLRDIATKYHAHGCLRELISREVNAALTQRPAEQAVPMTDEQVKAARRSACDDPDELPEPWAFRMGIRAAEAHHGIHTKGAQEWV